MNQTSPFRIGTRGSPLALAQARLVRNGLEAVHENIVIEEVVIKTTGDKILDKPLADIGGKGLFTKEIDAALLDGRIDCAVHSAKDVPTWLPDGLIMPCFLPREDPRDVLISAQGSSLDDLPPGSVVGTASLRRQAQILFRRKDLNVIPFRGNVGTRLQKLSDGQADATLLAIAGLKRLGKTDIKFHVIEPEEILPAAGQGAVGLMCRAGDDRTQELLMPINDVDTSVCVLAERAMLDILQGTCHTPIGSLAIINDDNIYIRGCIAMPDGFELITAEHTGHAKSAVETGREIGRNLMSQAGANFMAAIR